MTIEINYSELILLTQKSNENVIKLLDIGADGVELMIDGIQWDDVDSEMNKFKKLFENENIKFTVHPPAWDTNLTSENKEIREASFSEYSKSIEFAHDIGATHVVIHPGFTFSHVFDKEVARKRAAEYLEELCKVAAPLGISLAVENVGYGGTSIFTEDQYCRFLDDIDPVATYLIDTGHAHLNDWDIPRMIRKINSRLSSIHLHDNLGKTDEHLPIGEGTIEWEPIFKELNKLDKPCQLILEYAPGTDLNKLKEGKKLLLHHLGS